MQERTGEMTVRSHFERLSQPLLDDLIDDVRPSIVVGEATTAVPLPPLPYGVSAADDFISQLLGQTEADAVLPPPLPYGATAADDFISQLLAHSAQGANCVMWNTRCDGQLGFISSFFSFVTEANC